MSDADKPESQDSIVQFVTTRSDAEIAADLKRRVLEDIRPVLQIFDEAAEAGLLIQWDSIKPQLPRYKHEMLGLRIVKYL
ncbi:MAG: hypothetical protein WDN49_23630 [Acetobacteraceae bacterium]